MANMFSGKSEKQIPKTLSECTSPDATASNLHIWSERLERLGKILFWLLIILGTLFAILSSVETVEVPGYYYSKSKTTFHFEIFLSSMLQIGIYAFIEYCAYHVLALLISALACITQNTIISANVALYTAAMDIPHPETVQSTTPTSAPKAPVFMDKKTDTFSQSSDSTTLPNSTWVCKDCGANNSSNYGQCKKCGKFRS